MSNPQKTSNIHPYLLITVTSDPAMAASSVPEMAIAERFDFTGILMHVLFSFVIDDSGGSVWQDWVF